jgi:hypothetical protein
VILIEFGPKLDNIWKIILIWCQQWKNIQLLIQTNLPLLQTFFSMQMLQILVKWYSQSLYYNGFGIRNKLDGTMRIFAMKRVSFLSRWLGRSWSRRRIDFAALRKRHLWIIQYNKKDDKSGGCWLIIHQRRFFVYIL